MVSEAVNESVYRCGWSAISDPLFACCQRVRRLSFSEIDRELATIYYISNALIATL